MAKPNQSPNDDMPDAFTRFLESEADGTTTEQDLRALFDGAPPEIRAKVEGKTADELYEIVAEIASMIFGHKKKKVKPCYESGPKGDDPATILIAPRMELPIEIIGTHEADKGLTSIHSQSSQGAGIEWEFDGQKHDGYFEVMKDDTIFACLDGLHIRFKLPDLFGSLLGNLAAKLSELRQEFNNANGTTE